MTSVNQYVGKLPMILYSTDNFLEVKAYICEVGNEINANNEWQWVLPFQKPCECTSVVMGGINTWIPTREFVPVYALNLLVSDNINEIREHYNLTCDKQSKFSKCI